MRHQIMGAIPAELKTLKLPRDWGDWNILSGKELDLPAPWVKQIKKYGHAPDEAEIYLLEIKGEEGRKKVVVEAQIPFPVASKDLGKLDGVLMPLPCKLILHFDPKGDLVQFHEEQPSQRDVTAARNRILALLADGKISPPGEIDSADKPWKVVLDDSGKFRLERVFFG